MTLALLPEEKAVLETVLWFANLKRIMSTRQVEKRFAALSPGIFQVIEAGKVEAYRRDQAELREWMLRIANSASGRKVVANVLAPRLAQTVHAGMVFDKKRLRYAYALTGVQACYALGVALLLDETRGLADRLKQCGNAKCGRFNLSLTPGKMGRPRRFCNDTCKRLADNQGSAERQRAYRMRHA